MHQSFLRISLHCDFMLLPHWNTHLAVQCLSLPLTHPTSTKARSSVEQAGLKLSISSGWPHTPDFSSLQPPLPNYWDYRRVPTHLVVLNSISPPSGSSSKHLSVYLSVRLLVNDYSIPEKQTSTGKMDCLVNNEQTLKSLLLTSRTSEACGVNLRFLIIGEARGKT